VRRCFLFSNDQKERLTELAAQIVQEKDPETFNHLVEEMKRLLDEFRPQKPTAAD